MLYLFDGRIAFLTGRGGLYSDRCWRQRRQVCRPTGPGTGAWVVHPDGEAGNRIIPAGDAARLAAIVSGKRGHEWVVSDLRTGASSAHPIDVKDLREVLLYGSVARDNAGNAYAVGWRAILRGKGPLVLRIEPWRRDAPHCSMKVCNPGAPGCAIPQARCQHLDQQGESAPEAAEGRPQVIVTAVKAMLSSTKLPVSHSTVPPVEVEEHAEGMPRNTTCRPAATTSTETATGTASRCPATPGWNARRP